MFPQLTRSEKSACYTRVRNIETGGCPQLSETGLTVQHVFQQRVVVEHINSSRFFEQRVLEVRHHLNQRSFRQRIEQVKNRRLGGKANPRASAAAATTSKQRCDSAL